MAKFRPVRDAISEPEQVKELLKHAQQVDTVPVMHGQLVEGVLPAGATFVGVRHSLGRPYVCAFLAGTTGASATTFPVITVVHRSQAIADGWDISTEVPVVTASVTVRDEAFVLWVM